MTSHKTPILDYFEIPKSAVWNTGQLSKDEVKTLEKQVRLGELSKARSRWRGISNLKTVYFKTQ